LKFEDADAEMLRRWDLLIEDLERKRLLIRPLKERRELIRLIQDPHEGRHLLEQMRMTRHPQRGFFPSLIAGESNLSDLSVSWYVEWFFENAEAMFEEDPAIFLHFFLNQFMALILGPNRKFLKELFRLHKLVNKIERRIA
jgi:hypothetical protein